MRMFGRRMDMCILINTEIIIMHMTFSELYLLEILLLLLLFYYYSESESFTEENTQL